MNNTRMFKILWALSPAKFFLALSITLLIFSACNKSTILGLEVQPENDLINAEFVDTLTLNTQTVKEDSLRSNGQPMAIIGKYMDPVFGETSTSLYTQIRMYSNAPTFGKNPKCDSVRISLIYVGAYGKKIRKNQTISVYQLTEALDINATYYSDDFKNDDGIDLANQVFTPAPTDSVVIDKIKYAPQLRITLPSLIGQKILDKQGSSELATNDNFFQFIKGFKITTENTPGQAPEEGNLLQFNMNASTFNIYYTYYDSIKKKDTAGVYNLTLGSVARFMNYKHDYAKANPDLQKQVVLPNPPITNDICYIQGTAGVKTRVTIPHLLTWGNKNLIAINRAELIVTSINTPKDTFSIPPALSLYGISNDGTSSYFVPDEFEGSDYFGGMVKTDTVKNITTYSFAITRYVQQVLTGHLKNNGIFIRMKDGVNSVYRVSIGGGKPVLTGGSTENKYQMKLNITYTNLK